MRLGGERRIVDHAHQRILHAGLEERFEDPHRVAAAAAAGIVGDIGEDQRGSAAVRRALREPHGVIERGQRGAEPLAPRPAGLGDLARQRLSPPRRRSR